MKRNGKILCLILVLIIAVNLLLCSTIFASDVEENTETIENIEDEEYIKNIFGITEIGEIDIVEDFAALAYTHSNGNHLFVKYPEFITDSEFEFLLNVFSDENLEFVRTEEEEVLADGDFPEGGQFTIREKGEENTEWYFFFDSENVFVQVVGIDLELTESVGDLIFLFRQGWFKFKNGNTYEELKSLIDSLTERQIQEEEKENIPEVDPEEEEKKEFFDSAQVRIDEVGDRYTEIYTGNYGYGYDIFEPENGLVASKRGTACEIYKCELAEELTFSFIYEQGNYVNYDGVVPVLEVVKDGERADVTVKHYVTERPDSDRRLLKDFITIEISGSGGNIMLWRQYDNIYVPERNEIATHGFRRVIDGIGYSYIDKMPSITLRGGVIDGEIVEIWISTSCGGQSVAEDIEYKAYDPDIQYCNDELIMETFSLERNSTIGNIQGVPEDYQNMTKEEMIEEHNDYYDENGEHYGLVRFDGVRPNGLRYEDANVDSMIDFVLESSIDGISDNGITNGKVIEFSHIKRQDGEEDFKTVIELIYLKGNLGEELYMLGGETWHQHEGTIVYDRENFDTRTANYRYKKIVEVTDEYFVTKYGSDTTDDITIHFGNEERTEVDTIEFDFEDKIHTVEFENFEYTGPFMSYFLRDLGNWPEMAKSFGLTPVESEE